MFGRQLWLMALIAVFSLAAPACSKRKPKPVEAKGPTNTDYSSSSTSSDTPAFGGDSNYGDQGGGLGGYDPVDPTPAVDNNNGNLGGGSNPPRSSSSSSSTSSSSTSSSSTSSGGRINPVKPSDNNPGFGDERDVYVMVALNENKLSIKAADANVNLSEIKYQYHSAQTSFNTKMGQSTGTINLGSYKPSIRLEMRFKNERYKGNQKYSPEGRCRVEVSLEGAEEKRVLCKPFE